MEFPVPRRLLHYCRKSPERRAWLERLPHTILELSRKWRLSVGPPFLEGGEASWVAPVVASDGSPAVLKLGMPHYEAEHETQGLRFWNGETTVRLLDFDDALGAMLLERCEPGTSLALRPEAEQDLVLAATLRSLWRTPPAGHSFRPLSLMIERWIGETREQRSRWPDPSLVLAGLETLRDLAGDETSAVLLATDAHAGNVLCARREPWLLIDPKPFVGDPAYDATQHLLNCDERMSVDPLRVIERWSGLLALDPDRVRRWMFGRLAAGPRSHWANDDWRIRAARVIGSARTARPD